MQSQSSLKVNVMAKYHYQLVQTYGEHDLEVTVYEAKKTPKGDIQIAPKPFVLVGNTVEEVKDTLKAIERDLKLHPPVVKEECDIYHDVTIYEEYYSPEEIEDYSELAETYIMPTKRKYRYDE